MHTYVDIGAFIFRNPALAAVGLDLGEESVRDGISGRAIAVGMRLAADLEGSHRLLCGVAARLVARRYHAMGAEETARDKHRTGETSVVIVCQGPPRCSMQGDAAIQAQRDGCYWCKRIIIAPDGSERVSEPGNA